MKKGKISHLVMVALLAAMMSLVAGSVGAAVATYSGSASCSGCHAATHTSWLTTLHAQAYNAVEAASFLPVWAGVVSIETSAGTLWAQLDESGGTYTITMASDEATTQVVAGPLEIVRVHGGQPIAGNANNNVRNTAGTVRGLRSGGTNPIYPNGPDYYPGESPYLGKQRYHVTINGMEFILPFQYNPTPDLDGNNGGWVAYHAGDWINNDYSLKLAPNNSEQRRCAGCHQTGLTTMTWDPSPEATITGSNPSYEVTGQWSNDVVESVIGCEMCHGPGSTHAGTASAADITNPADLTQQQQTDLCGFCHSRGHSQGTVNGATFGYPYRDATPHRPIPGDVWGDFYVESGGYHIDDPTLRVARQHHQQYEEFMLSNHFDNPYHPMSCIDCHDAHNTAAESASIEHDLITTARGVSSEGQTANLCYGCHQPYGFPNGTDTDRERHYWHPPQGTHGSPDCTNCHMPAVAKSGVNYDIHSHSFISLGVEYTLNSALPNACMIMCHTGPYSTGLTPGPTGPVNPNLTSWTDPEDTEIATFLRDYAPSSTSVAAYLAGSPEIVGLVDDHTYMAPALDANRDTTGGDVSPFTINAADVVTFVNENR